MGEGGKVHGFSRGMTGRFDDIGHICDLMGLQKTIPSQPPLQRPPLWRSMEFDSATSVRIRQVDTSRADTLAYTVE